MPLFRIILALPLRCELLCVSLDLDRGLHKERVALIEHRLCVVCSIRLLHVEACVMQLACSDRAAACLQHVSIHVDACPVFLIDQCRDVAHAPAKRLLEFQQNVEVELLVSPEQRQGRLEVDRVLDVEIKYVPYRTEILSFDLLL